VRLKRLFRTGIVVLALAAILGLALALFTNAFGRQLIPGLPLVRLQRVERFATSSITLESVRRLSEFTTVRYVHRAVFPYDYLPANVSLNEILRKLRTTDTTIRETLTEDEYLYFRTWNLAEEIDLSTTGGTYDFVVLTLIISAGFDAESGAEEIVIEREPAGDGDLRRRATVKLARPLITDVAVEDIDSDEYPYPDLSLSADAWRRVAEYVRERSVPADVLEQVLRAARANGERFIRGVLLQAGFDEVRFADDASR
jgi:hypothetical protein